MGGPDSTGPANARAATFLRAFLDHVVRGKNYVTGQTGSPLDFVSFHAKGAPHFVEEVLADQRLRTSALAPALKSIT